MKLSSLFLLPVVVCGCLLGPFSARMSAAQIKDGAPDPLRTLSHEELDVVKVLTAQEGAWNNGDLNGYASGYKNSPDDLFISQQVIHGFDPWLADERHAYPNKAAMGTLSFSGIEPHLLDPHYAVVLGRYHLDRSKKAGGAADGMFSLVLEKTDKGWKIIVDHTT